MHCTRLCDVDLSPRHDFDIPDSLPTAFVAREPGNNGAGGVVNPSCRRSTTLKLSWKDQNFPPLNRKVSPRFSRCDHPWNPSSTVKLEAKIRAT